MDMTMNEMLTWVAGGAVSLLVKNHNGRVKELEAAQQRVPEVYVRKDDYKSDIAEIKGDLKSLLGHVMGGRIG